MTPLAHAFIGQAQACARLDSPFMDRLLTGLAQSWPKGSPLDRACAAFEGDIGPNGASLPLRIAGGLHALVLHGDSDLSAVYPPNEVSDQALIAAVVAALDQHQAFILDWIKSPPQTNEVRRSAVIIAAAHWLAARHPLPFVTSELGASAGLNLMWDRFGLQTGTTRLGPDQAALTLTPDWSGPVPPPARVKVAARAGVDLRPIDPRLNDEALRLCAYLWPDQPYRAELTRAAISALDTAVEQGDAIDWLENRLRTERDGQLHLIYHTIAWQYFPQAAQDRGKALIEAAGAQATATAPLAWLRMENDGGGDGAAVTLRLWPGNQHIDLGRADFHGRWIHWATG